MNWTPTVWKKPTDNRICMDERTIKILEFDKIREKLAAFAVSEAGASLCVSISPSFDAQALLEQTDAAAAVYRLSGKNPVESFPDMRDTLKRVRAAYSLNTRELMGIGACLRCGRLVKERLVEHEAAGPLRHMAGLLFTNRGVEEEIARCIIAEDEISDAASAELASIRRQIRVVSERARDKLNGMVKSAAFQKYLQEPIITLRNGRFVLPVKQEARNNVPGLIHDQSGSGATLFIEPVAVVELGNEYKRLLLAEQEEIERILVALTAMVEPGADSLISSIEVLAELDLIFAKAALGREMRATRPELGTQIKINAGRHPLIADREVVPIDVWLGGAFNTLIITGPNTGGKTVTLKTIGLFTLMAQAGLYVPAADGTALRAFKNVFADIGDEQSIEQSLSTFSSHMGNIVSILEKADEDSLVLLDELGAGTDPVEGAALAMSILDKLHSRGVLTAATTHYSEIKAFALCREQMENASMEFDVDRLCPTYKLFIGIPGKSNAFEIARRLGLGKDLIEKAREFLTNEDVEFEDVIQSAQVQRQRAALEHEQAQALRYELEQLRATAEKEKAKLEREKSVLRAKAKEEARAIVRSAREEMGRAIAALRNTKGLDPRLVEKAVTEARSKVRDQENALIDPVGDVDRSGDAPKTVRPGDRVKVLSLGQNATVQKAPNAKGEVQVQAGIIKLNVPLDDLRAIDEVIRPHVSSGGVKLDPGNEFAGLALDLRGRMVDEAIIEVDKYIDDAVIHGREEIQIIHGKGTGALKKGIHQHLRTHKYVKSYRIGAYGEGDSGVTIVSLR